MQESEIVKTLLCGGEVSFAVIDSGKATAEAMRRHAFSPVAAAAFGRTMTAAAYLCSWLKNPRGALSVTVNGGGVGGKICVTGDASLRLCGFAEHGEMNLPPRADGKLDVGGFVGKNGTIDVIRNDGTGVPFDGSCNLVSGEIAEDFSAYFTYSEQRPTAIALGVLASKHGISAAGGVFFQPLPGASEESISFCEEEIQKFAKVSSLLEEEGAEGIMRRYSSEFTRMPLSFSCFCSRERAASAVVALGKADAEKLLSERGEIEVHCHYCNTDYTFGAEECEALFKGEQ